MIWELDKKTMNSREIVLANINHQNPPRCGLDFDRGRISDFLFADLKPHKYKQKRWVEGAIEYYEMSGEIYGIG